MAYRVSLSQRAEADAYAAFEYLCDAAPEAAVRWLNGLFAAIASLDHNPGRCSQIQEARDLGLPVRQLLCGRGRGSYRIIFLIRDDERHVRILRIYHAFRRAIAEEDVNDLC